MTTLEVLDRSLYISDLQGSLFHKIRLTDALTMSTLFKEVNKNAVAGIRTRVTSLGGFRDLLGVLDQAGLRPHYPSIIKEVKILFTIRVGPL